MKFAALVLISSKIGFTIDLGLMRVPEVRYLAIHLHYHVREAPQLGKYYSFSQCKDFGNEGV